MYILLMVVAIFLNLLALLSFYGEFKAWKAGDTELETACSHSFYKLMCYSFVLHHLAGYFKVAS